MLKKIGIKQFIYPISLIILLVSYYLLYLNRCYPVNEGWHITYAKLLLSGKVPYRDFYYYMPPLDIFFNAILWKLSGGYFLVFRIFRMTERCFIFLLLYNELKRLVKPINAWFSCVVGGIFMSANVYDLLGDYNQTVELLCVMLACAMVRFAHAKTTKSKSEYMLISGGILGLAFLHKQTLIVSAGMTLFLFLIFYCYIYKESFVKCFTQALVGLIVPISICFIYLVKNSAWNQFWEQVFLSADSKGGSITDIIIAPLIEIARQYNLLILACGITSYYFLLSEKKYMNKKSSVLKAISILIVVFEIFNLCLYNITSTVNLMFHCGYVPILIGVCIILVALHKTENYILYLCTICGIFLMLEFFMYRSYNGFSYRWYTETSAFSDMEKLSNTLFIILILSILYLSIKNVMSQDKKINFQILCVCSFISSYAGLMTAKYIVPAMAMGISASLFIALALEKMVTHNKTKNIFLIESCLILCMMCMGQKITCAFSWWGTKEAEIYEETYPIKVKGLEGFRVSKEQSKIFEEVVKTIEDNTHDGYTLMGFPGVTIFNLLTGLDFAGFTPVYFYDVCADEYATKDAEAYENNPPNIVVWWDIPGCLETHEALFRDGQTSGQRKIIEWFAEQASKYTLICQVNNVFVYKLNDKFTVGYTYIENKNVLPPSTIYAAKSSTGNDYEDYSLEGEGTSASPYLIQSTADLVEFREMVNIGLDFGGKYVVQTNDIDLSTIPNWIPIGKMGSGKYFFGTYDGLGHTISNLTISKEPEDAYGGLFGQLGGVVKNLGLEKGFIYGNYIGGIASHAYNNPQIINCYFKGTLESGDRAGGIADNFSGGQIINCYFEGIIKAKSAYGIVSYQADSVIDSISVGYADFNDALVSRGRNNIVLTEISDDISNFFNYNIVLFSYLGLENLNNESYYNWQLEDDCICFSSETQMSRDKYGFLFKYAITLITYLTIILYFQKISPSTKAP